MFVQENQGPAPHPRPWAAAACALAALPVLAAPALAGGGDAAVPHDWLAGGLGLAALLALAALAWLWRANRALSRQLRVDSLTGMPSPRAFFAQCRQRLAGANAQPYVLLAGDIRQFKVVNDQLGFATGDSLLQALGIILQNAMAPDECCTRFAADQFVLLLRFQGWDRLQQRLRELEASLDRWRSDRGLPYKIELAYGAYQVRPSDSRDAQLMLDLANYARLEAKARPGASVVPYDEHMRQQALLRQELNGRLESALAAGEIQVWHQARVDMRSGSLVGSEALARWQHPSRGLLLPRNFVPLLERSGMVAALDLFVFEQVCRHLRSWRLRNLPLHPVSCNFSRELFDQPDLPRRMAAIARRHNVPAALLEVEIAEAAVSVNPETAWMQIIQLRSMGFRTIIDDFGAGHSALGILQMLSADALKIDRSFIRRDLPGQRAQAVLSNVIRLAGDLGMGVICGGVETAAQAETIQRLGCHLAQGHFFARPEPPHEFEARLAMQGV